MSVSFNYSQQTGFCCLLHSLRPRLVSSVRHSFLAPRHSDTVHTYIFFPLLATHAPSPCPLYHPLLLSFRCSSPVCPSVHTPTCSTVYPHPLGSTFLLTSLNYLPPISHRTCSTPSPPTQISISKQQFPCNSTIFPMVPFYYLRTKKL